MLFPPAYSEGRTADIYGGLVLSLKFSVPDHFSMYRFALRDAGLFGGYFQAQKRGRTRPLKDNIKLFHKAEPDRMTETI